MASMRISELFTGLVQHFPTTMLTISLIGGLALGRASWALMGLFGMVLGGAVFALQIGLKGGLDTWMRTSGDIGVIQACAMAPTAVRSTYQYTPSIWATLTTFFLLYILQNANAVYTAPTAKLPIETAPVQHRKSVGVVSILATLLLLTVLLIIRYRSGCETPWGYTFGIALGALFSLVYMGIAAAKSPLVSDVHGVMMGLQPASLRSNPLACAPRAATATTAA